VSQLRSVMKISWPPTPSFLGYELSYVWHIHATYAICPMPAWDDDPGSPEAEHLLLACREKSEVPKGQIRNPMSFTSCPSSCSMGSLHSISRISTVQEDILKEEDTQRDIPHLHIIVNCYNWFILLLVIVVNLFLYLTYRWSFIILTHDM
jgi:hypothetical protein